MTDVRARLGAALRECRERQRLTQEQLAERSALSYKFIGEIERGNGNPTVETLDRLARALGVGISTLFLEADQHRAAQVYQISKHDLMRVREALESITEVTDSVATDVEYWPRPRRKPRARR